LLAKPSDPNSPKQTIGELKICQKKKNLRRMTTLPLFWRLSSIFKANRIDASVKLISTLEHFQSQFVASTTPESSEDESEPETSKMDDGLDGLNAQDVSYSIRRLVRGLASPRECSRLGFAVALTEVRAAIQKKYVVPTGFHSFCHESRQ
jgi:hypothetical protein